MENITLPTETLEKIERILATGKCALTREELITMEVKKIAKTAKKSKSKSNNAKWESRANVEEMSKNNSFTRSIAEINRENAEKNLPSSMRK